MKAYLDVLLGSNTGLKESFLQSQLYYKDSAIGIGDSDVLGGMNDGLRARNMFIKESRTFEMIGPLYTDISNLSRYLLNNMDFKIVLWTSNPNYHLISDAHGVIYQTKITHAQLNVCYVYVSPHILIAHSKVLAENRPAIYPYRRSEIKKFSVGQGAYNFATEDIFLSQVPQQIIICMTSAQAAAGALSLNPFNLKNYSINYLSVQVNGENLLSTKPQTPRFGAGAGDGEFMESYLALQSFKLLRESEGNDISRTDFQRGFTVFCYDIDHIHSSDPTNVKSYTRTGNVSCEMVFADPLPEAVNIFFYAQYNSEIRINKARGVELIL